MLIRLFPKNAITIARIAVNNKGIGIGSKIIEAMINYSKKNKLEAIYIESILSIEMINLALKYNFKPVKSNIFIYDDNMFGNYKLDINTRKEV